MQIQNWHSPRRRPLTDTLPTHKPLRYIKHTQFITYADNITTTVTHKQQKHTHIQLYLHHHTYKSKQPYTQQLIFSPVPT